MKLSNIGKLLLPLLAPLLLVSACFGDISFDPEKAHPQVVPVWSPDGARILFTYPDYARHPWGSDYMYAVETDGSRLASISDLRTDDSWYADYSPTISRDGRWVAFATLRHKRGLFGSFPDFEIARTGLDGSDYRRLTDHDGLDTNPVWSPDGTRLAFVSYRELDDGQYNRYPEIYTMGADGSGVQRVTPPSLKVTKDSPAWSPDGLRLAFLVSDGKPGEERTVLHTIAADGGDLRRIAKTTARPAWSPDGTRIAFATYEANAHSTIYTARPDGSDVQELTEPSQAAYSFKSSLSWSLDGSEIRFLGYSRWLKGLEESYYGIHAIKVDGSGARLIAALPPLNLVWAAWSPDGSRIAGWYGPRESYFPGVVLFTFAADGSDPRVLVSEQDGTLAIGDTTTGFLTGLLEEYYEANYDLLRRP